MSELNIMQCIVAGCIWGIGITPWWKWWSRRSELL